MALGHWAKDYLGPHEAGGSGGGVRVVEMTLTDNEAEMQITAQELLACMMEGTPVMAHAAITEGTNLGFFEIVVTGTELGDDGYTFTSLWADGETPVSHIWAASGPDEYPTYN